MRRAQTEVFTVLLLGTFSQVRLRMRKLGCEMAKTFASELKLKTTDDSRKSMLTPALTSSGMAWHGGSTHALAKTHAAFGCSVVRFPRMFARRPAGWTSALQ